MLAMKRAKKGGHMRLRCASVTVAVLAALVLSGTASAQAETFNVHETFDVTGGVLTCPEENVIFNGTIASVITGVTTPTGVFLSAFVWNLGGLTAVGEATGTVYRVVGAETYSFTSFSEPLGQPRSTANTFVQTWLLLPVGGGQPLRFQEVMHVTWDQDGNLVSSVFIPSDCDVYVPNPP
jgi:hypothetical protein